MDNPGVYLPEVLSKGVVTKLVQWREHSPSIIVTFSAPSYLSYFPFLNNPSPNTKQGWLDGCED